MIAEQECEGAHVRTFGEAKANEVDEQSQPKSDAAVQETLLWMEYRLCFPDNELLACQGSCHTIVQQQSSVRGLKRLPLED